MNLESLKYFKSVVEEKSISKVAATSHISQSALSQIIHKMEDKLGYKLLIRSNKGVEPTEMGKVLLKYSDTILRTYDKMLEELEAVQNEEDNVNISGYWSMVNYSLPCVLYKVKQNYPEHKLNLTTSTFEESIRDIANDIVDLSFVNQEPEAEDLFCHNIGTEKIVLVANMTFDIPDKITLDDLFDYDIINLKDTSNVHETLGKALSERGKDIDGLKIVFDIDSITAAKSSIHNGHGISFLPFMSVKKEIFEGKFKVVEVEDFNLDYEIYLISKPKEKLKQSVKDAINCFVKIGEEGFC